MIRLFVVGCSRSGTTILQRVLYEQLSLVTLPETNFFGTAAGGGVLGALGARLGIGGKRPAKAHQELNKLLMDMDLIAARPDNETFAGFTDAFVASLDHLASLSGATGWIEKTPKHFRHVSLIQRYIPEARFVHVIRYGPDVVASIVDRAQKNPGNFNGQDDPDYGIRVWNKSIDIAYRYRNCPEHIILPYDIFSEKPVHSVRSIGLYFSIPAREPICVKKNEQTSAVTHRADEPWKANTKKPIKTTISKFGKIFSTSQQDAIIRKL